MFWTTPARYAHMLYIEQLDLTACAGPPPTYVDYVQVFCDHLKRGVLVSGPDPVCEGLVLRLGECMNTQQWNCMHGGRNYIGSGCNCED